MEVLTPKSVRRNTRLRVEIPITVRSIDRKHPFLADCLALVVSPQGCGFRAEKSLPLETPVLISALPGGGTSSGRVANCLPLGSGGKYFLIGVSLYNPGNVWGITDPPEDWNSAASSSTGSNSAVPGNGKSVWPYNRFSNRGEAHPGRK
jgi:hypothetical protein